NLVEQTIGMGIEAGKGLALVGPARNHVKQMGNDTTSQEALAMGVEIHAPGIAGPFREDVKLLVGHGIAPDGRVHLDAVDLRMGKDTVQTIQPSVRTPLKGVERLVRILAAESFEQHFLLVAFASPFRVAEKEQAGRGAQENAAVPHLDAAGQVKA